MSSDTIVDVIMYWSVAFKAVYPNVKVQFSEGGSSTVPTELRVAIDALAVLLNNDNERNVPSGSVIPPE